MAELGAHRQCLRQRHYLSDTRSRLPETLKLRRRHADVTENLAERSDFQIAVAVHRNRSSLIAAFHEVVTAANAGHVETESLQELHHLLAGDARQLTHAQAR